MDSAGVTRPSARRIIVLSDSPLVCRFSGSKCVCGVPICLIDYAIFEFARGAPYLQMGDYSPRALSDSAGRTEQSVFQNLVHRRTLRVIGLCIALIVVMTGEVMVVRASIVYCITACYYDWFISPNHVPTLPAASTKCRLHAQLYHVAQYYSRHVLFHGVLCCCDVA
jgi:hypothetical protein